MHNNHRPTRILLMSLCFVVGAFFIVATAAHAQVSIDFPTNFAGFSSQDLKTTISNIVRIIVGFLGVIFIMLLLYGGLVWMTSQGERDKIDRAKKIIGSAVIGLLVTLSSYAIASFIIQSIQETASPGSTGSGGPGGGPGGFGFALGAGALESHYPGRNATDIPRNTNIFITFKEAMDSTTICSGANVNVGNIEITDINNGVNPDPNDPDSNNILDTVSCAPTDALNKTFKFDPNALLGVTSGNTLYKVVLKPGIRVAGGQSAFPLSYSWQFTVSTFVDETPPKITSVYPPLGAFVDRNTVVQINFSEPVDPTTASGIRPPFSNITLTASAAVLNGSYISSNQFQTIEFFTDVPCGVNSCGGNVYCLPRSVNVAGVVNSTVVDMADNQLDGEPGAFPSGNGTAGGAFTWNFDTKDNIDLTPPVMESRVPIDTSANADLYAPVESLFSELLSASSVTSNGYKFDFADAACTGNPVNFWTGIQNVDTNGDSVVDKTRAYLNHDTFQPLKRYCPVANSNIKDLQQNCYFPASCSPGPC